METTRFFISELPVNCKEKDLEVFFQDYGEIVRIEIKSKKNPFHSGDVKPIAFVTLKINSEDAQYCANDLSYQKLNGRDRIKVSLAKESFLDRLKREREEANVDNSQPTETIPTTIESSELLIGSSANTRKTFNEDDDNGGDYDDEEISALMITKKRAANSLKNGKIIIESFDETPLHVVDGKKHVKNSDFKSRDCDQKRKESVNMKKHQYNENKSIIQKALSGLNNSSVKRIKFNNDDEEDEDPKKSVIKKDIFGSEDEESNAGDKLNLRPEHFGKKGEKLIEMQSRQGVVDSRFKIDERFVNDVQDDNGFGGVEMLEENERDWQINLLEQVVGTKVDSGFSEHKRANNKKMLRFDPMKDEHKKYLRTKIEETIDKNEIVKRIPVKSNENVESQEKKVSAPKVSKEVYYVVTDTLSQSLKTRGDGFSLLNMFGQSEQMENREEQLKNVSNEKILVNANDKKNARALNNPFQYDSSSDSENEEQLKPETIRKTKQVPEIVRESFFISRGDIRLKEGAQFFKLKIKGNADDYQIVREGLNHLINAKIRKTNMRSLKHKIYHKKRGNNSKVKKM